MPKQHTRPILHQPPRSEVSTRPDERDAAMMARPASWPRWPFLPLKRRSTRSPLPETALLYASVPLHIAYDADLFDIPSAEWTVAPTIAELIAAGWMVD